MDCVYISEGSYNKQFRKREIRKNVNEKNENDSKSYSLFYYVMSCGDVCFRK